MYANGAALWEGWTKNWFLGLERNWALAVLAMGALFIVVGDVGDTYRCIADLSAIIG
jgi:hypothetical protein